MAEPQTEPGVGIGLSLDVRDAPLVAADRERGSELRHPQFAGRHRESSAEHKTKQETGEVHQRARLLGNARILLAVADQTTPRAARSQACSFQECCVRASSYEASPR